MQKHEIPTPEVAAINRASNAAAISFGDWLTQTPAGAFVRLSGLAKFHVKPELYKARFIARAVDTFTYICNADDADPKISRLLPAFEGDTPLRLTAELNEAGARKAYACSIIADGQKVFTYEKEQTGQSRPSESFALTQGPWLSAFVQRFSGLENMVSRSREFRAAVMTPVRYF